MVGTFVSVIYRIQSLHTYPLKFPVFSLVFLFSGYDFGLFLFLNRIQIRIQPPPTHPENRQELYPSKHIFGRVKPRTHQQSREDAIRSATTGGRPAKAAVGGEQGDRIELDLT